MSFPREEQVHVPTSRVLLVGSGVMGKIRASLLYASPQYDRCGVVDTDFDSALTLADQYSTEPFHSLNEALAHFGFHQENTRTLISSTSNEGGGDDNSHKSVGDSSHCSSAIAPSLTASEHSIQSSDGERGGRRCIDAVVISTPTPTHAELIITAAKHGLHIFVEKPVDDTASNIANLYDTCERSGVSLCCGFQRRFDRSYAAAAEAVRTGKIGKPLSSTIFFGDSPCPPLDFLREGGEIFSDLCVHDVDFIRWALGDHVESVYATATYSSKSLEEAGIHDNATMVMKFKRGTLVTLTLSRWSCYGYDQRAEIFGERGLVTVGSEHANTTVLSTSDGEIHSKLKHSFPQRFRDAYAAELEAFADVALLGEEWKVTRDDAIAVQQVAEAAKRSCELNAVVYLNEDK